LHEINVCALNETQNVYLTVGRENKKKRAEKEKEPYHRIGKEMKSSYYEMKYMLTETLKRF